MRVILMEERKWWQFFFNCVIIVKIKPTINEPTHNEVKGEGLINCDTKTNISRQSGSEFIIEAVHFIKGWFLWVVYSMVVQNSWHLSFIRKHSEKINKFILPLKTACGQSRRVSLKIAVFATNSRFSQLKAHDYWKRIMNGLWLFVKRRVHKENFSDFTEFLWGSKWLFVLILLILFICYLIIPPSSEVINITNLWWNFSTIYSG